MIEKETLSLYKIKKDVKQKIFWESMMIVFSLLIIALLFWILLKLMPYLYTNLFKIVCCIILFILFVPLVGVPTVRTLKILIYFFKQKISIESDKLISKEDGFDSRLLLAMNGSIFYILFYMTRGNKRFYRLYFKCNDKFELPARKSYRWSSKYSMPAKDIYLTSDVGDTFTIVKIKNIILMVYNNKYFELSSNLL